MTPFESAQNQMTTIKLQEVVGFADNLKAVVTLNGVRRELRENTQVRGTGLFVKNIEPEFVEIEENGSLRVIEFEAETVKKVDLQPANSSGVSMSSDFGGTSLGLPGMDAMQPLPVLPSNY
jgi:type II secretory pathway component PulC